MRLSSEGLTSLLEWVRKQGDAFATPEDASFFRNHFATKKKEPALPSPPPFRVERVERAPDPKPEPKQLVQAEPAPQPKPKKEVSPFKTLFSIIAPDLPILDEIPSDTAARKLSQAWKTKNQTAPISVLTFQEPPEQRALLEQIGQALDIYFGPAKVVSAEKIEREKEWGSFLSVSGLKLVIVCDYTLWQLNHLVSFYKETPAQEMRVLGNVPLFLLPDLSLYLKDPLLKRSLWRALCQKCS